MYRSFSGCVWFANLALQLFWEYLTLNGRKKNQEWLTKPRERREKISGGRCGVLYKTAYKRQAVKKFSWGRKGVFLLWGFEKLKTHCKTRRKQRVTAHKRKDVTCQPSMGEIASCKEAKGVSGEKIKKMEREEFPLGWCPLVEFAQLRFKPDK